ncbi:MAG: metal-dependent transcriptional regulator [Candidatus Bathyarchaeota archaeon]|nr:metal-dependent transcriptional regulator [Candidatus Bathyarchaeota archaeon]
MSKETTAVVEEYLETIYRLQEKSRVARTSDIVNMLQVVPGTVTNTVERLEKEGYITHEPYKGVKLTEKGLKIALQVVRRHRLSERLLTDILHMEWDKVHDAACKLEHGMTDEIIKPLEKTLGHPKTCPHGNPIPTKCGGIIEEKSQPLTALNEREQGTIVKITEEKADLLRYLDAMGLVPGASLEVVGKAPFNGPITVKVGRTNRALGREVASVIKVKRAM